MEPFSGVPRVRAQQIGRAVGFLRFDCAHYLLMLAQRQRHAGSIMQIGLVSKQGQLGDQAAVAFMERRFAAEASEGVVEGQVEAGVGMHIVKNDK